MPTSPTVVPLKRRLRHLVQLTVCDNTPRSAPARGVLADEQGDVAARLEHLGVLGPAVLDDELAASVERIRDQRVERPVTARAVAVHHDHLAGAAVERAAHGRVELLGVQAAPFLVAGPARAHLLPAADSGDALHVADDQGPSRAGRRLHRPQVIPIGLDGGNWRADARHHRPKLRRAHQRPRALLRVLRRPPGRVPRRAARPSAHSRALHADSPPPRRRRCPSTRAAHPAELTGPCVSGSRCPGSSRRRSPGASRPASCSSPGCSSPWSRRTSSIIGSPGIDANARHRGVPAGDRDAADRDGRGAGAARLGHAPHPPVAAAGGSARRADPHHPLAAVPHRGSAAARAARVGGAGRGAVRAADARVRDHRRRQRHDADHAFARQRVRARDPVGRARRADRRRVQAAASTRRRRESRPRRALCSTRRSRRCVRWRSCW